MMILGVVALAGMTFFLITPKYGTDTQLVVQSNQETLRQRLQVRPGCTGLWQVSKRNNCTFQEMVELDLKYIREQNFLYDISLIFRTVWVMIRPNGAS